MQPGTHAEKDDKRKSYTKVQYQVLWLGRQPDQRANMVFPEIMR